MSSILKVERRRAQALNADNPEQTQQTGQTAQLVDRYKFIDLYPGQKEELRLLGK